MGNQLFIYQEKLEELVAGDKIRLDGQSLAVSGTPYSYLLTPAVKITGCESSVDDPLQINNKYIPLQLLENAGADIYLNSITLNSHCYFVDQGFICDKSWTNEHS